MSLFEQAARLNNHGITALIHGHQATAIKSITKSIKLMKAALFEADESIFTTRTHEARTVLIPRAESSDTVIFNQMIHIPTTATIEPVSEFDMNIYTSAVIFNLGLAHQYLASSSGINKAEKLYNMVLQLLEDNSFLAMKLALVIKLGCINNLSQIRYSQGDYQHASEGVALVSNFFRETSTGQAYFEEPEIQRLLMNVLLLRAPSTASAA